MKLSVAVAIAIVALASPGVLSAQARKPDIPAAQRPPAGMCRIWLDNVPATSQPAPTDCASAVRNRPEHGRVIFGDDYVAPKRRDSTKKGSPAINGFAPADKKKRSPIHFP
jgi:hypothetical protein